MSWENLFPKVGQSNYSNDIVFNQLVANMLSQPSNLHLMQKPASLCRLEGANGIRRKSHLREADHRRRHKFARWAGPHSIQQALPTIGVETLHSIQASKLNLSQAVALWMTVDLSTVSGFFQSFQLRFSPKTCKQEFLAKVTVLLVI